MVTPTLDSLFQFFRWFSPYIVPENVITLNENIFITLVIDQIILILFILFFLLIPTYSIRALILLYLRKRRDQESAGSIPISSTKRKRVHNCLTNALKVFFKIYQFLINILISTVVVTFTIFDFIPFYVATILLLAFWTVVVLHTMRTRHYISFNKYGEIVKIDAVLSKKRREEMETKKISKMYQEQDEEDAKFDDVNFFAQRPPSTTTRSSSSFKSGGRSRANSTHKRVLSAAQSFFMSNSSTYSSGEEEDEEEPVLMFNDEIKPKKDTFTTIPDETVSKFALTPMGRFLLKLLYYPQSVLHGIRHRFICMSLLLFIIVALAIVVPLFTCNTCIGIHPLEFSTAASRYLSAGKSCPWNEVCYLYFTVPQNMSSSMIVNFHLYSYEPSNPKVHFASQPFDPASEAVPTTSAHCYNMDMIRDESRYQCFAYLTELQPSSTYYVSVTATLDQKRNIHSKKQYKFRTAPAPSSNETEQDSTINFVSGGDLEWTKAAMELCKHAASTEPLFAIIGGDVGYDNGLKPCYRRWDNWFHYWEQYMTTPSNYSVPILTAPGNHETAGFKKSRSYDAYYIRYFPHEIQRIPDKLNADTVQAMRNLTHVHYFGSHTMVIVLDSWVHTTPKEQLPWLVDILEKAQDIKNKFAVYHVALYPTKDQSKVEFEIGATLRELWEPVFNQYGVTVGLENHYHCFKVTYPLVNGTIVDPVFSNRQGTTYLGDGAWGVTGMGHLAADYKKELFYQTSIISNIYDIKSTSEHIEVTPIGYTEDNGVSPILAEPIII